MQTPITNKTKETYCSLFKKALIEIPKEKGGQEKQKKDRKFKRTKSTMDLTNFEASKIDFKIKRGSIVNASTNYTSSYKVKMGKASFVGIPSKIKSNHSDYYKYKTIARICYYDEYRPKIPGKVKPKTSSKIDLNLKVTEIPFGEERGRKKSGEKKKQVVEFERDILEEESFTSAESQSTSSCDSDVSTISENTLQSGKEGKASEDSNGKSSQFTSSSSDQSTCHSFVARGNTQSVLSFLVLRGGKDKHTSFSRPNNSLYNMHATAAKEVASRLSGIEGDTRECDSHQDLLCQICNEKVFNKQEVACFSICEHYLHEFCLIEMINRKCFKFDVDQKNKSLFCPKCKGL